MTLQYFWILRSQMSRILFISYNRDSDTVFLQVLGDLQFHFYHRWFDVIFLVSALTTMGILYLAHKQVNTSDRAENLYEPKWWCRYSVETKRLANRGQTNTSTSLFSSSFVFISHCHQLPLIRLRVELELNMNNAKPNLSMMLYGSGL